MYHTKSCPRGRLILVLVHGERSSSPTMVQPAIVVRFVFAAIGRRNHSPSSESSLGLPFQGKVQEACIVA
eukprot:5937635-Ditylum_brightwellii.AAC.1